MEGGETENTRPMDLALKAFIIACIKRLALKAFIIPCIKRLLLAREIMKGQRYGQAEQSAAFYLSGST